MSATERFWLLDARDGLPFLVIAGCGIYLFSLKKVKQLSKEKYNLI